MEESKYIHFNCRNRSDFIPMIPQNHCVETFKKVLINELKEIKVSEKPGNLTYKERKVLEDLKRDDSIVIKSADKGVGGSGHFR